MQFRCDAIYGGDHCQIGPLPCNQLIFEKIPGNTNSKPQICHLATAHFHPENILVSSFFPPFSHAYFNSKKPSLSKPPWSDPRFCFADKSSACWNAAQSVLAEANLVFTCSIRKVAISEGQEGVRAACQGLGCTWAKWVKPALVQKLESLGIPNRVLNSMALENPPSKMIHYDILCCS